ncbi:MAG: S24/S26 family peptidase [Lachnospiraceae bacterium]|nr:S24/S26 family peptidase [Lachnospiraceae bacterium]
MEKNYSYEEILERDGRLVYKFRGVSMRPLLHQGRDLFILEKKPERPFRKGEVVAFRRGKDVVLHRIIRVEEDGYTILGDNSVIPERGVRDEEILGVMTGYIRKGKTHQVEELPYRIYSRWILATRGFRIPRIRLVSKIKRLLRRRTSEAK